MQILSPGTRIGQYEIASIPMVGGMGVVYFALDHGNDGRPVALKTFRPELLPDRAARDRFLREGTAWIELGSHPHIVRCYKVEYFDPTAFLVLELIAKEQNMPDASLRSWLIPGRPLPVEQALLFALQIARGMQYATEKIPGFVHRDLKPENILVGADKLPGANINRLRVTDFGLVKTITGGDKQAKADNEEEIKLNQIQFTRGVGTPLYMAPEQWSGEAIGVFTDIYALGTILYEMVSGNFTAKGRTIEEIQKAHCKGKLQPLPISLPKSVITMLLKCLSTNPSHRYQDWNELIETIEHDASMPSGIGFKNTVDVDIEEQMQGCWSHNAIGLAYQDLGKFDLSTGYFDKALMIARNIGNLHGEETALGNLGVVSWVLGNLEQAMVYINQALEIDRGIGNRRGEGSDLGNLGLVYEALGDMKSAINCYEQALTIDREVDNRREESANLSNIGNAYESLGDARKAISFYEQALIIDREMNNRRGEGSSLNNIGEAYSKLGDVKQSIEFFKKALTISREIGDRYLEENSLGNFGIAYALLGNFKRAVEFHFQALKMAQEIGDKREQAANLGNLGLAYIGLGDSLLAIDYHKRCLELLQEVGDKRGVGNALGNLGFAYQKSGDIEKAIQKYEEALVFRRQTGDRYGEATDLSNLGVAYAKSGDVQNGILYSEQSLTVRREIGDLIGVANTMLNVALLYKHQGELVRALPLAKESEQLYNQIGHIENAQRVHKVIAELTQLIN